MSEQLTVSQEVSDALSEVRADKSGTNFAVIGYEDADSKTLVLFGKGNEGVNGVKTYIKEDEIAYILLRIEFNYETVGVIKADVSRFLFIYFRPESVPLKRKKMLGSVEGQIKKLFSPFIRTYEVDTSSAITEEKIKEIVDNITNKKERVTDKKAANGFLLDGVMVSQRSAQTDKKKALLNPDSRASFVTAKGADVTVDDEAKLSEELQKVRSDTDATRWCLFTYADKKTLTFQGSGEGDVTELLQHCEDDKISYGLFRFVEKYSSTIEQVKFGFVTWVPEENISPILKAVVSTHRGFIVSKFHPFHIEFKVNSRSELTEEIAINAISSLTGTKSHVTDKKAALKVEKYERKFVGGTTSEVQQLKFENKEDLQAAITACRSDNSETTLVVAKFSGDKKSLSLEFLGTELDLVSPEAVQYVLIRTKATVDKYEVSRYVLVKYEGEDTSIGFRGACGVFHGAVSEVFGSVHKSVTVGSKTELQTYL